MSGNEKYSTCTKRTNVWWRNILIVLSFEI